MEGTNHGRRPGFPEHDTQLGLATYQQLRQAGWTESQIRHARAARWQTPFPTVMLPHRGQLTPLTRLRAASLWAGAGSVLTGLMALEAHGVMVPTARAAHFLVPGSSRARSYGTARTIRTTRPVPVAREVHGIQVTTAVRALVDSAVYETLGSGDLEALTIAVLQRGHGTPEELDAELHFRPALRVVPLRAGLVAFRDGAWSRPEKVLRTLASDLPDLPPMLTNCGLRTPAGITLVPDGYIEAAGLGIQVHSRQFHQGVDDQGGDRWARTVEQDSEYAAAGVRLLGVTPWTLYRRPKVFVDRLRRAVEVGLTLPRPDVEVLPRYSPKGQSEHRAS